jgi:hypothetical protein
MVVVVVSGMGRRRKIVTPGKIWATDRRTTRRYFLFSPAQRARIGPAFWYCLAVAAEKHGILVYAALLMSTHPHLVYADPRGVQPLFKRDFHRMFAMCVKAILGWPEEVFNKSQGGEHEPLSEEALIEDIAYLIANPCAAFAVRYAKDWPGPKTLPEDIGRRTIRFPLPECYFDPDNTDWPKEVVLQFHMPECLEDKYGADETREMIAAGVRRREQAALAESKRLGIPFKGVRRVLRTPHTARARSYEVFGKVNPRFRAAGDRERARRKIEELHEFDVSYDCALARWTRGDRRAVFPYGVWWMRVHHAARTRPPP